MITKNVCTIEEFLGSLNKFSLSHDEIEKATETYYRAISSMERYIPEDRENKEINLWLGTFQESGGSQMISEGSVNDRSRPVTNSYNWHLQNTSQWLFAFGLVFDKQRRDFSMHT